MDYKTRYAQLNAEYLALVNEILESPSRGRREIPKVTALASQIAKVLDDAAKDLAMVPGGSEELERERTELVQRLQQIQQDYSGLVQNTDKIETLHRIRAYQDTSWRPTFTFHLVAFFVLVLVLFLVILFLRQRENTTTSPMSATINPAFT